MKPGERYRLRHDVDRFPHFIAPAGAVGTIVDVGDPGLIALKMDEVIPGAETWENELHWYIPNGDNPTYDLVKEEPVTEKPLACRHCGSDNIAVWYSVPERQGIEIHGLKDGGVSFDFDGVTDSGGAEGDDEYWCLGCDSSSSSLEFLLGVTEEEFTTRERIERTAGLLFQVGTILQDRHDNAYPGYATANDPVWEYLEANMSELYDRFGAVIDSIEDELSLNVGTGAETVRQVTEKLASVYGGMNIEEDHNGPPMDTSNYEGRAMAFITTVDGVQVRVLVEDITPDDERRSYIYQGIE